MAPPCPLIEASDLPITIQQDVTGKRRKLDAGKKDIDLSACELFEMFQYKCEVQRPLTKESPVRCFAVDRIFRRCKDRNGPFMVETTSWEPRGYAGDGATGPSPDSSSKSHHWNPDYHGTSA